MSKDRMRRLQKPENFDSQAFEFISQQPERQGQALTPETRSQLEPGFGHSFADVRVFSDLESNHQAQGLEARAFTVGHDIHFASGEYAPQTRTGRALLAHELSHVVQNSASSGQSGISQAGDATEIEAARASEQVLAGQPAQIQAVPSHAVQRFGSREHRQLGHEVTGDAQTNVNYGTIDQPRFLKRDEMVALAGDYFGSLEELRSAASTPEGRQKIWWARWDAFQDGEEPVLDKQTQKKFQGEYFKLAANNFTHFSGGGTAHNEYQKYHLQALQMAFEAGKNNDPSLLKEAQTIEAFGHHFLTDMFSAGHVRTPRQDIKSWYAQKFPNSVQSFVGFMAGHMKTSIDNNHPIMSGAVQNPFTALPAQGLAYLASGSRYPNQAALETQIATLGGEALKSFSLGDLVSLALHNSDNKGLFALSEVDSSGQSQGSGLGAGHRYMAVGDSELNTDKGVETKNMAVGALKTSLAELDQMEFQGAMVGASGDNNALQSKSPGSYHLGAVSSGNASEDERNLTVEQLRLPDGRFAAERFVPTAAAPSIVGEQDGMMVMEQNTQFNWQWGNFNPQMRQALDQAIVSDVVSQLQTLAKDQDKDAQKALLDFAKYLEDHQTAALEEAIGSKAGGN